MTKETKVDLWGLTGAGVGTVGSVGSVVLAGGGTSAANITTGLAKIGGLVNGGMLAGLGLLAIPPVGLGALFMCAADAFIND